MPAASRGPPAARRGRPAAVRDEPLPKRRRVVTAKNSSGCVRDEVENTGKKRILYFKFRKLKKNSWMQILKWSYWKLVIYIKTTAVRMLAQTPTQKKLPSYCGVGDTFEGAGTEQSTAMPQPWSRRTTIQSRQSEFTRGKYRWKFLLQILTILLVSCIYGSVTNLVNTYRYRTVNGDVMKTTVPIGLPIQ
jgi:hypothetical protein